MSFAALSKQIPSGHRSITIAATQYTWSIRGSTSDAELPGYFRVPDSVAQYDPEEFTASAPAPNLVLSSTRLQRDRDKISVSHHNAAHQAIYCR
eukprot:371658-Rhodomonas_salina.1